MLTTLRVGDVIADTLTELLIECIAVRLVFPHVALVNIVVSVALLLDVGSQVTIATRLQILACHATRAQSPVMRLSCRLEQGAALAKRHIQAIHDIVGM